MRDERGRTLLDLLRDRFVGASAWTIAAPAAIATLALGSGPILIEGEHGVGKRFVARALHECGADAHGPFVMLGADSLPPLVLEGMLFGDPELLPKAMRDRQRMLLEQARGGTLYVTDVAALPPTARERIGRAVDRSEIVSPAYRSERVRLVFGTSTRHAATAFRIPSLRERVDDVLPLAKSFLDRVCRRLGKEPRVVAPKAARSLERYDWPGNVGELERVIDQAMARSGPPVLDASVLPPSMMAPDATALDPLASGGSLADEVRRYERSLLVAALSRCDGIQTKAAHLLGIKPTTLHAKLAAHGVDPYDFKRGSR